MADKIYAKLPVRLPGPHSWERRVKSYRLAGGDIGKFLLTRISERIVIIFQCIVACALL